jgi:AraC-like DNA-binding protein
MVTSPAMYREFVPNRQLQPFVECCWRSWTDDSPSSIQRVIPDGCVDLIFDLTPGRETAFWVGTMTRPMVVEGGRARDLLGIRFHPGGAKGLLNLRFAELTDEHVPFRLLTPSVAEVLDQLLKRNPAPLDAIERWLTPRLEMDARSPLVQSIFRHVKRSSGNVRVGEIAASLGLSRQYLNRVMNDCVGVDLKTFSRIIRMRACITSLRATGTEVDWSIVATDFGFYDQSHLIHEFNDLVGLSPRQFLSG